MTIKADFEMTPGSIIEFVRVLIPEAKEKEIAARLHAVADESTGHHQSQNCKKRLAAAEAAAKKYPGKQQNTARRQQ